MLPQAELIARLQAVPPLPQVAQRVLACVRDPDYSVDELVGIVRTDPALTARILRLCNSAVFGLRAEANTVADAVAYLGTRNMIKLVLASCTAGHFRAVPSSDYADANTLWRHSFAIATTTQWLAKRAGYAAADTAFTLGILHDLGRLVLSQVAVEQAAPAANGATSHIEREQAWFGIDHAAAAGLVADAWGLPRELRRALCNHHEPMMAANDHPLPQLLQLGETLVLQAGIGNPFPDVPLSLDGQILQNLHLQPQDTEAAIEHCQAELLRHADLLNLDPDQNR
jgi:HD-like signal output (HDOD) protein